MSDNRVIPNSDFGLSPKPSNALGVAAKSLPAAMCRPRTGHTDTQAEQIGAGYDSAVSRPAIVTLMSFGFKYGLPNANHYFDVGFLRNPARDKTWGFFSKPTDEMRRFVLQQAEAREFLEHIEPLLLFLSRIDQQQVFAFGCNSGRHRSSILVDELAERLRNTGIQVNVYHRDNGS